MIKHTNAAPPVVGGALLGSVSVSPAVSPMGGVASPEGKCDLLFLGEDDDACNKGHKVLGVNGDNHQSGLLGALRISASVKVPG